MGEFSQAPLVMGQVGPSQSPLFIEEGLGDEHLRVQALRAGEVENYDTERFLSLQMSVESWNIEVKGRVDGFFINEAGRACIEEIKTSSDYESLLEILGNPLGHPYGLQLLSYCYIYQKKMNEWPEAQFVFAKTDSSNHHEIFSLDYEPKAVEEFFAQRLEYLAVEGELHKARLNRRKENIKSIQFPFSEYRKNQESLIQYIEESIKAKKVCFYQAPTGLGKTAASLWAHLKNCGEKASQLVYVTPKNSQQLNVVDTALEFNIEGLKVLQLRAQSRFCNLDECSSHCPRKANYYEYISDKENLKELEEIEGRDSASLEQWAGQRELCPYLLQMDLIKSSDLIVGDYNYIISETNSIDRFHFGEPSQAMQPSLVVDEAHNIVQRSWDEYSVRLEYWEDLNRTSDSSLNKKIRRLKDEYNEFVKGVESQARLSEEFREELFASLRELLEGFYEVLGFYSNRNEHLESYQQIETFYFLVHGFSRLLSYEVLDFAMVSNKSSLDLLCYDASQVLKQYFSRFHQLCFFSGTLKPVDHHARLLGFSGDEYQFKEFASPFPREKRKLMFIPQISTRSKAMAVSSGKVAELINRVISQKKGNYLAFFPSYRFLNEVASLVEYDNIIEQKPGLSSYEVKEILDTLETSTGNLLLGVQGGVLSEGIDYKGSMAEGVFVIGPGLSAYSQENRWRRDYFESRNQKGENTIFIYPALRRSIQAAGRVIRSEEDRAFIILVDDRFLLPSYSECFPEDWFVESPKECVPKSILRELDQFWQESDHV